MKTTIMKTSKLHVLILLFASLAGTLLAAPSPLGTGFTYQGRLKQAGQSVNGNFDLKFTLYDAPTGTGQVGSPVTVAPVVVDNGNFTVLLDFGAVFNGEARWLEIAVRAYGSTSPYGTPSARQALTPTPYALYAPKAGDVANVGSKTAAEVVSGVAAASNATPDNTANTIVKRDANRGFLAGAITAESFNGTIGTLGTNVIAEGASAAYNATVDNARSTIVKRDFSGSFSAYAITAVATITADSFNGKIGTLTTNVIAQGASAAYNATSASTANTIVKRDSNADFSARKITATYFSGNGAQLTQGGLVRTTVLNVPEASLDAFSVQWYKVADIGTFNKELGGSTIEVTFNGRIYVGVFLGEQYGAHFELRVDSTATSNGRARAHVRTQEAGGGGIQASITGIFTGLSTGYHTVSMWVRNDTTGAGQLAKLDPSGWGDDHVVVKELK
jgi:hypothetical protein